MSLKMDKITAICFAGWFACGTYMYHLYDEQTKACKKLYAQVVTLADTNKDGIPSKDELIKAQEEMAIEFKEWKPGYRATNSEFKAYVNYLVLEELIKQNKIKKSSDRQR